MGFIIDNIPLTISTITAIVAFFLYGRSEMNTKKARAIAEAAQAKVDTITNEVDIYKVVDDMKERIASLYQNQLDLAEENNKFKLAIGQMVLACRRCKNPKDCVAEIEAILENAGIADIKNLESKSNGIE